MVLFNYISCKHYTHLVGRGEGGDGINEGNKGKEGKEWKLLKREDGEGWEGKRGKSVEGKGKKERQGGWSGSGKEIINLILNILRTQSETLSDRPL